MLVGDWRALHIHIMHIHVNFCNIEFVCMISECVQEKVVTSWQLGVKALLHQKGGLVNDEGFLAKAAGHIKLRVCNDADTVDK